MYKLFVEGKCLDEGMTISTIESTGNLEVEYLCYYEWFLHTLISNHLIII